MYKRHRFPPEIIQHVVWLYHRFNLSSRAIEDLMAERGGYGDTFLNRQKWIGKSIPVSGLGSPSMSHVAARWC